jgi:hypothetical protein
MAYRSTPMLPPTHSLGLEARYPLAPFHPLVLKIRSGSYCTICGVYNGSAHAHLDDYPCSYHFTTADATFLSSTALDVQRKFLHSVAVPPVGYIPTLPGNTIEQERRYWKVLAAERQCRISLAMMAQYTWERFSARRGK